jgi:hypothetical protein
VRKETAVRRVLFLISLALSSVACSDPKEFGEKAGVEASSATASVAPGTGQKAEPFAFARKIEGKDGASLEFSFQWPAQVSAEKELAKQLDAEREERFAVSKDEWESSVADCPPEAVSCRTYSYANEYQVIADLPRFLSLSNSLSTYTGGAHGLYGKGSQVWDRESDSLIDPETMFTSQAALEQAVGAKACAALDRERHKRRGEAIDGPGGEWPNNCPGMNETTLFLGSSNGKTFDRLGLYYGPYVAGPYAEGEYEINLPVDAAVIAAVKPEFASAFSMKR